VLSVPKRLRYYLQSDPSAQNLALHMLRYCARPAFALEQLQ
jgi:hypothetical protein